MPVMDGYELTRAIRKLEQADGTPPTPIIACTANALSGEAEVCFAAGMNDYLVKPADLSKISEKLDRWLPIPQRFASNGPLVDRVADLVAPGPVDRTIFNVIVGDDAALERHILTKFRDTNNEDVALLKEAVSKNDLDQIKFSTHRIRGACSMLGAMQLVAACEAIDSATCSGDAGAVKSSMAVFRQELTRLDGYIEETLC
jgi:HPt (histidine-containing phosphotransfer) domain-containing protein